MTRPLRIQYQDAVYHVTCRGIERKEIFRDEEDRRVFLKFLKENLETFHFVLYCYVLMLNHFHLFVETPLGNLSEFMRRFNIVYTYYFNKKYERIGNLYQGRYRSILVEKERHLNVLSSYIHLNPVRKEGMKEKGVREKTKYLLGYNWSSLGGYIEARRKEKFVHYGTVLEDYGGDNWRGRESYLKRILEDV